MFSTLRKCAKLSYNHVNITRPLKFNHFGSKQLPCVYVFGGTIPSKIMAPFCVRNLHSTNPVKRMALGKTLLLLLSLVFAALPLSLLCAYETDRMRIRMMLNTIEKGNCPQPSSSLTESFLPRKALHDKLMELLTPIPQDFADDNFYLVTGEHGTGKTTSIRNAAIAVGVGVIYADVPPDLTSLPQAIADSFNYTEENINFWWALNRKIFGTDIPPYYSLKTVLATLSKVANDYRLLHNKPMVLILDNINQIAKQDLQLLASLQYFAKTEAQENRIKVCFVTSEGKTPIFLGGNGANSRMQVVEIGDITKEEALEYLEKKQLSRDMALNLYELCGGRLLLLNNATRKLLKNELFSNVKKAIFADCFSQWKKAGLLLDSPIRTAAISLAKALLVKDSLSSREVSELIPDYETESKLLSYQVFAWHPEKQIVTFQSQAMKVFFKENPELLK